MGPMACSTSEDVTGADFECWIEIGREYGHRRTLCLRTLETLPIGRKLSAGGSALECCETQPSGWSISDSKGGCDGARDVIYEANEKAK